MPIVGGVAAAGAAIYAAKKQSKSADKAGALQAQSTRDAMAFEREQFEYQKAQDAKRENELRAQWEAEQARREPFRRMAAAILGRRGIRVPSDFVNSPMPAGWTPGAGRGMAAGAPTAKAAEFWPRTASLGMSEPLTPALTAPRTITNLRDLWNTFEDPEDQFDALVRGGRGDYGAL